MAILGQDYAAHSGPGRRIGVKMDAGGQHNAAMVAGACDVSRANGKMFADNIDTGEFTFTITPHAHGHVPGQVPAAGRILDSEDIRHAAARTERAAIAESQLKTQKARSDGRAFLFDSHGRAKGAAMDNIWPAGLRECAE